MFIQREGISIQSDWEMSPLEQPTIFPWNIYKNSFQKNHQVCGGRLVISEGPRVSLQQRGGGGRAAPWPLALSLQLVVRRQMMREPTPGKIIDPPNQRFPGKSGNDTPPLGRHHHGHDDKKNFYKWEKKAQL